MKTRNRWNLKQAADFTQCGENCGMCKPYLSVVEATGMTEVPLLNEEEINYILSECDA